MNKRKLIIIGYAQHGKTISAKYLAKISNLKLLDASEFIASEILVKNGIYESVEEAFENKEKDRKIWYNAVAEYTKDEPDLLIRNVLKDSDVYCGCRRYEELQAYKEKYNPYIVWINNPRKPKEPETSCTVKMSQADLIIENDGTLEDLYKKLNEIKIG